MGTERRIEFIKKTIIGSALAGCFLVLFLGLLLLFARPVLTVKQLPRQADLIVVLGGGANTRVMKAAQLYHQGYASKILVVGKNEEQLIGKILLAAGIPETDIIYEPQSRSTYENAAYSLPLMTQWQVNSVLLVTSWFHSRRSVAVFRSIAGMPEVISVPTDMITVKDLMADKKTLSSVLKEYLKLAGYWLRYGVSPVLKIPSEAFQIG